MALFIGFWIVGWLFMKDMDLPGVISATLLYFGLVFFYVINYSAVEHASPTLTIMGMLGRAGSSGVGREDLSGRFERNSVFQARLDQLVSGGMIEISGGRYRLVRRGFGVWRLVGLYRRRILGRADGG